MFDVIVLDLDGTLLKNDKTVSEETLRVLKRYEKLGKQIVIATARPPRLGITKFPKELQEGFMIFYNGGEIHHNKERIHNSFLSLDSANNIKNLMLHEYRTCTVGFEINNKLYINFSGEWILGNSEFEKIDLKSFELDYPAKILIDMDSIDNVDNFRLKLPLDCHLVITDNGKLGHIMASGVNKLSALKYILTKLGTSIDKVMFFGDDINDIELIKECGIGVAMGNAATAVKEIADYVTTSNEENGIASFLNSL